MYRVLVDANGWRADLRARSGYSARYRSLNPKGERGKNPLGGLWWWNAFGHTLGCVGNYLRPHEMWIRRNSGNLLKPRQLKPLFNFYCVVTPSSLS
jgi:hypothetical protein